MGESMSDDLDVSAELVRRGAAWVYRKYAKDQNLYKLEDEARSAKRGLWSLTEAQRMPPWEWRRRCDLLHIFSTCDMSFALISTLV